MLENEELLEKYGWTEECSSPFEIRHTDGSFATGQAAYIVMAALRDEELYDIEEELGPQFEYLIDTPYPRLDTRKEQEEYLKKKSIDRWELCHIIDCDMTPHDFYFKRKKQDNGN